MSVTVVVPTWNRRAFLPDVVAALRAQSVPDLQVVLVDDGSTDGSAEVAAALVADDPRFTVVSTPNRGPAAARNAGCRTVTTEWIAFTDDDCLPRPDWLEELVRTAADDAADVVQGVTLPDPSVDRSTLPWHARSQRILGWSGRYQTCNLLVRAQRFVDAGGFDVRFPSHGFGEDTDLGLRLVRGGAVPAFAPGAVVHHRILPMGYVEFLRRRYRWAQVVRLVAVNPDARRIFPYPYVAYRAHLVFWASVPVAMWAAWSRHWVVLVAGLAAFGAVQGRRSSEKRASPLARTLWGTTELPGVAAAAVGFVVESVRNRRLLL